MSKKNKKNKKHVQEQVVDSEFTLEALAKEYENEGVVVIDDNTKANEVLLNGMIENLVDKTIETLVANGFREMDLVVFREEMFDISRKAFMDEINKDEAQMDIARLIINKLSPENRVYTDTDINQMVELGTKLTPKQFDKFGMSKKELKSKIGEYCEHLSEKHGFIKEKLTNTLYKFFRDNWNVFNKEFDDEFRKVLFASCSEHFEETGDVRITEFSSKIGSFKSEDVFKPIPEENDKDKVTMRRTNPELEVISIPREEGKKNTTAKAGDIVKMFTERTARQNEKLVASLSKLWTNPGAN